MLGWLGVWQCLRVPMRITQTLQWILPNTHPVHCSEQTEWICTHTYRKAHTISEVFSISSLSILYTVIICHIYYLCFMSSLAFSVQCYSILFLECFLIFLRNSLIGQDIPQASGTNMIYACLCLPQNPFPKHLQLPQ